MMLVWNILKVIGIILLCILALLAVILICILFVPIRYRLKASRNAMGEVPINADIKITWLLHLITATYIYPTQCFLKIKILGIPVYASLKKEDTEPQNTDTPEPEQKIQQTEESNRTQNARQKAQREEEQKSETEFKYESAQKTEEEFEQELEQKLHEPEDDPTIIKFIKKLFNILKNIKYTILKLYDKIKKIIKDIRYYVAVVKSNCFKRAYALCKTELFFLFKSIFPKKINGNILIGTGDPASTAQILAIHGMLYPIIGNHINIIPDFENTVLEGNILIKGKITTFKILRTAIRIYFNKDIRKIIRLLKREAA